MQKCEPKDVVAEARRWVGTPYRHQWSRLGRGCDCSGFVRGVGEALGIVTVPPEIERELGNYSRTPDPAWMGSILEVLIERTALSPRDLGGDGYIAWMEWRAGLAWHLAIRTTLGGRPMMIHALKRPGACVEHGFTQEWRNRVHSWWRFRGVAYG